MRWRVVLPLAVVLAVTGGAVFVVVDRNGSSPHRARAGVAPSPLRSPVLSGLAASEAPPSKLAVHDALGAALRAMPAGEQVSGTVVDVDTGVTLWGRKAGTGVAPASTLKVLTAAAALRRLGPDYRFTTTTRLAGNTVYLVGGGDPTLAASSSPADRPMRYPEPATLTELASQTAAALPAGEPIHLRADTAGWSTPTLAKGWNEGYVAEGDVTPPSALELDGGRLRPGELDSPRTTDPAGQAAAEFASLLGKDGVTVRGPIKKVTTPTAATGLATVSSPPLAALVQRMLTDSDNDLAEALGRAVAVHDGQPPTFAGEVAAITAELAPLGVAAGALALQDASGLSHDDRVAPAALAAVLRSAAGSTPGMLRPLIEGLPVAGFTGTLADRYRGRHAGAGTGYVRAKTGSLVGVNALAGVVVDGSGRLLAFALMGSGTVETDAVQTGLDDMASALAGLA
ncbi:MAG TPA: D-alanyl-D-alanine carboxypeptidase/D-alanyl-D-alanine-endopeptidase [Mycobacteriales bacterium]|nr:D-alanyl-D-alanine carboxypeptidase/D-alanyl-D-alanine-endopeptidase [Mycobacteriales bacterium]